MTGASVLASAGILASALLATGFTSTAGVVMLAGNVGALVVDFVGRRRRRK